MSAPKKVEEVVDGMEPEQLLKLAESLRKNYVESVLATTEKLDPERLRGLDLSIKRLKSALNRGG